MVECRFYTANTAVQFCHEVPANKKCTARQCISTSTESMGALVVDNTYKVYYNSFKLFSSKNKEVMDLIDRSFLDKKMKKGYKEIWMKKQALFGLS